LSVLVCTGASTACPPPPSGPGVSHVDLGGRVVRLAGNGAVWAAVRRPSRGHSQSDVVEVDSSTGQIVGRPVALPGVGVGLDISEGVVWTLTGRGFLLRIDARSHRTLSRFRLPAGASGLAVGEGGVWITNTSAGTVSRIDPAAGRVTETVDVSNGPGLIVVGAGAVWVQTELLSAPLYRIDPRTGRIPTESTRGSKPSAPMRCGSRVPGRRTAASAASTRRPCSRRPHHRLRHHAGLGRPRSRSGMGWEVLLPLQAPQSGA
jgi:outer membrane protein assembly factor BamB